MCGIIGVYGKGYRNESLKSALDKISHRGTKNHEIKTINDFATLGANRLPIVGREDGIQPISNEDETIWAVLNGEIFNYPKLRKDLESKDHKFKSNTDTEVLVHLYEEHGQEMIKYIDSEMFAFVVYDAKQNQIIAARDPIGVKPLYYAFDEKQDIYFFSELKQIAGWENIKEILTFLPGTMYRNGEFSKYFNLNISADINDEAVAEKELAHLVEEAVKKRVQTDLPIAVLLSGGVDSSLVMYFAHKYHKDVTAVILGTTESTDYQAAVNLCKEKGYKYEVVTPDSKYLEDLDQIIYYAETYEPNIIRHCFANHMVCKKVAELGIRIALVGEGSDEIFGGYNEFTQIDPEKISLASQKMTETLENSNLQRADRMSMRNTIEARVPFLDEKIVNFAFSLAPDLKVRIVDGKPITKYIIRKVASRLLPESIAWRYKAPFANGAGMNVGENYKKEDGEISAYLKTKEFKSPTTEEIQKYKLETIEDKYYFSKFKDFHYDKLVEARNRAFMKDTLRELFS